MYIVGEVKMEQSKNLKQYRRIEGIVQEIDINQEMFNEKDHLIYSEELKRSYGTRSYNFRGEIGNKVTFKGSHSIERYQEMNLDKDDVIMRQWNGKFLCNLKTVTLTKYNPDSHRISHVSNLITVTTPKCYGSEKQTVQTSYRETIKFGECDKVCNLIVSHTRNEDPEVFLDHLMKTIYQESFMQKLKKLNIRAKVSDLIHHNQKQEQDREVNE